ncbi:MAG: UDP-N-acetylmuramoyl-L-alanine--D-glutamate ligase [Desulfuromonadales bacterium]|nr:UDP-N-acetylmuramoyl-L-alanine--D-glutamate ligase [Desulfuromonadales bacterium]
MQSNYREKKIVVVGAGASGRALTSFFLKAGAKVTLSDARSAAQLPALGELESAGARLDLGGHSQSLFECADLIVISPGVPLDMPVLVAAKSAGVPILGEIEVAWRELEAPMVAITGTNGKSTVTALLGEVFQLWHKKAFVGGNFGTPLIEAVQQQWDWLAVELSSFQLETIRHFRPRYAMLLNITADHLDRYPDMAAYQAAKLRIFENMQAEDVVILNADDPLVVEAAQQIATQGIAARQVWFSSKQTLESGISLVEDRILWRWQGQEMIFPAQELKLPGLHNRENVMAALVAPLLEGCPAEVAWNAVKNFTGLPHRTELIGARNGVNWYDDSKGTNIGSVVKSLDGFDAPVTLIAGGKDKLGDLSPLNDLVQQKVAHLILIGEAAQRMAQAFEGMTDIQLASDMTVAVEMAAELTPAGGTVLLSPGCSSFDMFSSYQERGRVFAEAFHALNQCDEQAYGN